MSEEIEVGGVWYMESLSNGKGYEVEDDGSLSGYLLSSFSQKIAEGKYQDSEYTYTRL